MSRKWSTDIQFSDVYLEVENRMCPLCGAKMYICDHRIHKIYSLSGPLRIICKLVHCSDKKCPNHYRTFSPMSEQKYAMPGWKIGWDVVLWMGYRRFKRHWSIEQICQELLESYQIKLSADAVEDHLQNYQVMVSARQGDFSRLAIEYRDCKDIILTIDGLQPEKGHETLYVVRELRKGRVWFAEALISSSTEEISRLISQAKEWAKALGLNVIGWMSDKQKAFSTAISEIFPGTPHRYCKNHFIRDVAEEVLEKDSHAKVQMRKKIRGLRDIERKAIEIKKQSEALDKNKDGRLYNQLTSSSIIVFDYCSIVRGILNDNSGGPLYPSGLKMANALDEVLASINLNLKTPKKGGICDQLIKLKNCIESGLALYNIDKSTILNYIDEVKKIQATLDPKIGSWKERILAFRKIVYHLRCSEEPTKMKMSKMMRSFFRGLFVGGDSLEMPDDNLDLERWFKIPKGHERRINGRSHAGTRVVYEGPTLIPTLDAHRLINKPFTAEDLLPYAQASVPSTQVAAIRRRKVMKQGNSKKKGLWPY